MSRPGRRRRPRLEAGAPEGIAVNLIRSELAVMLTALRMLRATLGRDEADELAEVMALIAGLQAEEPLASRREGRG